jgi:LysR family transcriptional regulator, transcription activator of glutamate synthase operon
MELRQVQYFLGVAQAGTFGRAADDLHVAKSALSKQIKLLEDELGAELLHRGGGRREVELTEAGEAFLTEAVTIVEAMDQGRERVRGLSGTTRGRVNVVIAQGWDAWPGWAEMIAEFRRRHPALVTTITQTDSVEAIVGAVASGAADLGVAADSAVPEAPGVAIDVLHSEPLHIAVAPGHALAGRDRVALAELRDESWLLPPIEHSIVTRVAEDAGFAPRVEGAGPTPALVRSLVLDGAGICVLGRSETGFYAPAATLELVEPEVTISVFSAYRRAYRTPSTRAARDFLRECFGWPGSNSSD